MAALLALAFVAVPAVADDDLLPDDADPWMEDPFGNLELDMIDVMADLNEGEIHEPVEVTEPRIVSRLDLLIEKLEKACSSSSGGAGAAASASPTSPAADSTLASGPGGQGELRAPGSGRRKWADIPPKEREKILQSKTEGFPPGYEEILEAYFRALAAEEGLPTTAPSDDAPSEE